MPINVLHNLGQKCILSENMKHASSHPVTQQDRLLAYLRDHDIARALFAYGTILPESATVVFHRFFCKALIQNYNFSSFIIEWE